MLSSVEPLCPVSCSFLYISFSTPATAAIIQSLNPFFALFLSSTKELKPKQI